MAPHTHGTRHRRARPAVRYVEFLTTQIRGPNTRAAYVRAAATFFAWCEPHGLLLPAIRPMHVTTYIEEIGRELSASSVKQQLAAIRMLFGWLVIGQVVPHNPASAVREPKLIGQSVNNIAEADFFVC